VALGLFARLRGAVETPVEPRPQLTTPDSPEPSAELLPADVSTRDTRALGSQLIRSGRYALLLDRDAATVVDRALLADACKALEEDMALVPGGQIILGPTDRTKTPAEFAAPRVNVAPFYLDRFVVTNRDYFAFVAAGGYDAMDLWPQEIWPSVLQFVDQTGLPGPRFWTNGKSARGLDNHPVVGVCWHEAAAYARWVGKRLPTAAEWEKTASWPPDLAGHESKLRFPWGNAFESRRANTWQSGLGTTAPVDAYSEGCTPNGVYQLTGNVWEWVEDAYQGPHLKPGLRIHFDHAMQQVRGGAFDTYFETEATCHFQSGQPSLDRCANIGFRCAVSIDRLQPREEV
jgi:iron(II)-dependent oxidoreductase